MSLDTETLRQSFSLVVERMPDLTRRFYEVLFERYPQTRRMFGPSLKRQEQMLTEALVMVLQRLEDGAWLTATLRGLGARHVGYGVTDEMYDWVGDALLTTLAEVAGSDWSPRVAQAWTDAYGAIAGLMLEGAHSVNAPQGESNGPQSARHA